MQVNINSAGEMLRRQNNILILSHASPDGDTIGAAHALYYALTGVGKNCMILCADKYGDKFSYITEKARAEKASFEPEFIVAADVADEKLFGSALKRFEGKVDLAIDHHRSNSGFAKNVCLYESASSTCEVMLGILKAIPARMTPLIADCLYTGIATDTGCFKYSCTGANTHLCAAELIESGADYVRINRVMFDVKTKARMAVEREVLSGLRFFFGGKVAAITLDLKTIERTGATQDDLDGISAIPRMVEGVEAGVMFKEKSEGVFKISVRTTSYLDASELCAKFGGGGHARAAGCTMNGEKTRVIEEFIREAGRLL